MKDYFILIILSIFIGSLVATKYSFISFSLNSPTRDELILKAYKLEYQSDINRSPSSDLLRGAVQQIEITDNRFKNLSSDINFLSSFSKKMKETFDEIDTALIKARSQRFSEMTDFEIYQYSNFLESKARQNLLKGTEQSGVYSRELFLKKREMVSAALLKELNARAANQPAHSTQPDTK